MKVCDIFRDKSVVTVFSKQKGSKIIPKLEFGGLFPITTKAGSDKDQQEFLFIVDGMQNGIIWKMI